MIKDIILIIVFLILIIFFFKGLKELYDISEMFDNIFDSYEEQYNEFCNEMDKLVDLMNEYHELINAYQIPTIPLVDIKKENYW